MKAPPARQFMAHNLANVRSCLYSYHSLRQPLQIPCYDRFSLSGCMCIFIAAFTSCARHPTDALRKFVEIKRDRYPNFSAAASADGCRRSIRVRLIAAREELFLIKTSSL